MYSEISHQLSLQELETLTNALESATAFHIRWLSCINFTLVSRNKQSPYICTDKLSHKRCEFGRWFYQINEAELLQDKVFRQIDESHQEMHQKACQLIDKVVTEEEITHQAYVEFADSQNAFFEALQSLTRHSIAALGNIDFLTGLPNRRAFNTILEKEGNRVSRVGAVSSIVIADIDFFKKVNDSYGHAAGDKVLAQIARIFSDSIRDYDTVARHGGEEFVFCLPETRCSDAKTMIEIIRQRIEDTVFGSANDQTFRLSCSFGVSAFNRDIPHIEAMAFADSSLYQAKKNGRNKVVVFDNGVIPFK